METSRNSLVVYDVVLLEGFDKFLKNSFDSFKDINNSQRSFFTPLFFLFKCQRSWLISDFEASRSTLWVEPRWLVGAGSIFEMGEN